MTVDPNIQQKADYIRTRKQGSGVRESLASGLEAMSSDVVENKSRQNAVEDQFQQVIDETTGKDVISAPEIIAARNNEANLKARLDKENQEVTAQLAQTEHNNFKSSFLNHKSRKPMILWIDDDGNRGVYTKIFPFIQSHNIKMTSAVITNAAHGFPIPGLPAHNSRYYSHAEMEEMKASGLVEFIAHTHTHDINNRLTDMSVSELHTELKTNKDIMKELGLNHNHLVYPFGSENDLVHSVTRQYFRSAFDVGGGVLSTPLNQFKIPRINADAPSTASEVIAYINEAVEKNTAVVMTTHVDQYGNLDMDKMAVIVNHCKSVGIPFVTTEELVNEYGNLLQLGNDSIDHNGEIHGNTLGVFRDGHTDYTPNAPVTDFKKGTVTRLKLNRPALGGYRIVQDTRYTDGYGYIETHRDLTEDVFSFQLFHDVFLNRQLMRKWDPTTNDWMKWTDEGNYAYIQKETPNDSPNGYSNHKRTCEKVTSEQASAFDLPSPGLIFTERDNESGYTFQTFVPHRNSNRDVGMKIRHSDSTGTSWGAWLGTPVNSASYTRILSTITIPANGSNDLTTAYASATKSAFYIERVGVELPAGVDVKAYCWTDGELVIRFTNATGETIVLTDVPVTVRKLVF